MRGNSTHKSWWLLLIAGILLVLVGIWGIVQPSDTFLFLVKYLGFALIITSLTVFIHAFSAKTASGNRTWLISEGVTDMLFAFLLIFNPFLTVTAFPQLVGSWITIRGILKVLQSVVMAKAKIVAGSVMLVGVISIFSGAFIILFPNDQGPVLSSALNIAAILGGALYIYDAIYYRKSELMIVSLL